MIANAVEFRENIWASGEYSYPAAYGFEPNIHAYLHEDENIRPCMLVIPGGGYCMVVSAEGEPVAEEFFARGMNVFVLTYTTDITMSVPLKNQPLKDASRAVRYLRKNAQRFKIDPSKLSICGFSAGGHLCASLATHYNDVRDCDAEMDALSNRPDGVVLSYPVITSGEFTHIYSIQALVGPDASEEERKYFSLEHYVTKDTPPCFIWQTVEDDLVPVENSMLFAESCRRSGVPYAYYAFPHGRHGLSVWNERVKSGDMGEPYTFEQLQPAVEAVKNRTAVKVSEQRRTELMIQFFGNPEGVRREDNAKEQRPAPETAAPGYDDVAMWPELCAVWLRARGLM